jgi:ATP-binding cassette, sub-family E, member 1
MKKVTAIVERDKCHPNKCGHECIKYDPLNRSGGEGFHIGEHKKAQIDEESVTEMHKICAKMCPFDAIQIVKLPEELNKPPIHHYGQNLFRLFNLPSPLPGKVIGLIGVNGIGKSTAIKILAGILKPNLNTDKEATTKQLIDFFKGSETQKFFEQLQAGNIKAVYKPQQVELLQKTTKGKVRDLLRKLDQKDQLDKITAQLDITRILDRDISALSGGEMQRVAIAAATLKDANFYMFDEPTSYLDIKQRLRLSTFIRSLAQDTTMTMIIEHDLIVLDYITDFVHIMYGEHGAYGVVSGIKSSREGINIFLSGYLKEENIKFRSMAIKFERTPYLENPHAEQLCNWTDIKKTLGDFTFTAKKGEVKKGEIVGILGENGIGKTTFVKMLAGITEPDEGTISTKVTVSYKPQFIDVDPETTVADYLMNAIAQYKLQLIDPFGLEHFFAHKLGELSGGELQRVAIAKALSEDAELFLLDEPSAYLDVEQRLILSKVLKKFAEEREATILVVDHDLLFLDYLSNRLLIFNGEPARAGDVKGPFSMQEGMNMFLRDVGITFRREPESGRPRANKVDSLKDREQKRDNRLYYTQ